MGRPSVNPCMKHGLGRKTTLSSERLIDDKMRVLRDFYVVNDTNRFWIRERLEKAVAANPNSDPAFTVGFIEDEADLVDQIYDVVKLDDLRECLEKMPCNEIGEIDVPQDPLVKEYSDLRREYNRAMNALDIINRIAKSAKE